MAFNSLSILSDRFLQDLWHDHLLRMRRPILPVRVRPRDLHSPQIPKKPSGARDKADHDLNAVDGYLHSATLPPGGPRLWEAL